MGRSEEANGVDDWQVRVGRWGDDGQVRRNCRGEHGQVRKGLAE